MNMIVPQCIVTSLLFCTGIAGYQSYFALTSSNYANQVPALAPLSVLRAPLGICNRQCVFDKNCWSWYAYSANRTDYCVLLGANLRLQPTLTFSPQPFSTKWWEKVLDTPIRYTTTNSSTSSTSTSSTFTTNGVLVTTTLASTTSKIPVTSPPPTCNATTCTSCKSCVDARCGTTGPPTIDFVSTVICTIWPNDTYGPSITLLCVQGYNPVLLYRKVQVNTTNVTEYVLTPQEMYWVRQTFSSFALDIKFRTLGSGTNSRTTRYKSMSVSQAGELSLDNYDCCYGNPDPFGVPLVNVPYMNESYHPACGPFWNLVNSSVANNGTAFGASPCSGYGTALYGQPGFYNGTWRSGMAFASLPNEIITEIFVWLW